MLHTRAQGNRTPSMERREHPFLQALLSIRQEKFLLRMRVQSLE